jgi:hypothetical protein
MAAHDPERWRSLVVVSLFTLAIFVSALLLFGVQPMFAKMVLPLLGGTPAVWNTCMVFFQATLLAGYVYAHLSANTLGIRGQAVVHVALLLIAIALLPITVDRAWGGQPSSSPTLWLLAILLRSLGLPFFVVSTTTPLVQNWFSRTSHPLAHDPYFLYAASNTGSLAALLAYPLLVEPTLRLDEQTRLWTMGYFVLVLLLAGCASVAWRARRPGDRQLASREPIPVNGRPTGHRLRISLLVRGRWVLLAFIPSSLMLGLTTYITTDVTPMPLLWVVPLALYLLSFVLTFGRTLRIPAPLVSRVMPIVVVPLAATIAAGPVGRPWILIPLHLAALLVTSLFCHGELANTRPPADQLTEFFLWTGVGGVLGGIFNALLAPVLFNGIVEYPLALVLACLVRRPDPARAATHICIADLRLAMLVAAGISGFFWVVHSLPSLRNLPTLVAVGLPALFCFAVRGRPVPFALGVATLVASLAILAAGHETAYRERSFFGVSQVRVDQTRGLTLLLSGVTNHGAQSLDPAHREEPLSYYHRSGPIGQVFEAILGSPVTSHVAIIGLGTGSLACFGQRGQEFTFYEIDSTVIRIASNPRFFTFLQRCEPAVRLVLGDGRLSLVAAPDAYYGVIILDAFSSDAIPSHLLTQEALRLYLRKLTQSGLLAFHISNNHLDLEPTVANIAADSHLIALAQFDTRVTPDEARAGKVPSHWVVLARRRDDLHMLATDRRWHALEPRPDKRLWTDDFSNIFEVIKWR